MVCRLAYQAESSEDDSDEESAFEVDSDELNMSDEDDSVFEDDASDEDDDSEFDDEDDSGMDSDEMVRSFSSHSVQRTGG